MNEEEQPKLTLGEPPKALKKKTGNGSKGLLLAVLFLQLALVAIWIHFISQNSGVNSASKSGSAGQGDLKELALALEERSLNRAAAGAWERWLEQRPGAADRPQILYRIGKLYLQAGDFEKAATALIRSDLSAGDDAALKTKTGPKMVECLRKLGLYGEVSRELSRRVELGGSDTERGRVLATLAGESLTEADLDAMIENRVDQMLALQGQGENEDQRKMLIDQFRAPSMAMQLFQEMLQGELFTRRARELKLDQEEEFLQAREMLEQQLLASRFLNQHLEKIQPSAVDIEAYYQAFKEDYRDEETEKIPPLAEVQDQVLQDYVTRKQQESGQKLFRDLMVRYDVKMLAQPGQPDADTPPDSPQEEDSP